MPPARIFMPFINNIPHNSCILYVKTLHKRPISQLLCFRSRSASPAKHSKLGYHSTFSSIHGISSSSLCFRCCQLLGLPSVNLMPQIIRWNNIIDGHRLPGEGVLLI